MNAGAKGAPGAKAGQTGQIHFPDLISAGRVA